MPNSSSGDVLHFGAVRFRVNGSGNLNVSINSLHNVRINNLFDIPMSVFSDIEPLDLANFSNQRGQIRVGTSSIGESFVISKIVVFTKFIYSGYPQ